MWGWPTGWLKHMVPKLSRVPWEGEQVAIENKIAFPAVPAAPRVLLSPPLPVCGGQFLLLLN